MNEEVVDEMEPSIDVLDPNLKTPADNVFIPPSIDRYQLQAGQSYTFYSNLPPAFTIDPSTAFVLGVDEAGRGPVLGPMVYGIAYLPITDEIPILKTKYHFDDSKALTPVVRSDLMQTLCTPESRLHHSCGWATRAMSARDISAGMLKATGSYNLNAQAMDATIDLIHGIYAKGVNVTEIYIDTIGNPATYQKKLERIFPTARVVVAKKADSLYPCVSAASICAKVTRDAALEVCYDSYKLDSDDSTTVATAGWGSGYPSDVRCTTWLKQNMHPFFGWGAECRFSWGTAKDLLETKSAQCKIDWPLEQEEDDSMKMTSFLTPSSEHEVGQDPLANWFGRRVTEHVF